MNDDNVIINSVAFSYVDLDRTGVYNVHRRAVSAHLRCSSVPIPLSQVYIRNGGKKGKVERDGEIHGSR